MTIAASVLGLLDSLQIQLGVNAGRTSRRAQQMLRPGAAVLLDVETTDLHGRVIEVAVRDAADGQLLLDTLVRPGALIVAEAQAVHGISQAMVADAPTMDEVLPKLLAATAGRRVLAYNASYDFGCIVKHCAQVGLDPGHLGDWRTWWCLMRARSVWMRKPGRIRLGGNHRAAGDTAAAREVLQAMAEPYHVYAGRGLSGAER